MTSNDLWCKNCKSQHHPADKCGKEQEKDIDCCICNKSVSSGKNYVCKKHFLDLGLTERANHNCENQEVKEEKESEISLERTLREFLPYWVAEIVPDLAKAIRELAIRKVEEIDAKESSDGWEAWGHMKKIVIKELGEL